MKKMTSKIIAILLSMTLVFTMSGVAFADVDGGAVADQGTAVTDEAVLFDELDNITPSKASAEIEGINQLSIKDVASSRSSQPGYDRWDMLEDDYFLMAVTAPSTGWMWFDFQVEGEYADDTVDVYICDTLDLETGEFTYFVDASGTLYAGDFTHAAGVYAEKGTTYYLYMETPAYNEGYLTIGARAKMYSFANNRTIPEFSKSTDYLWVSGISAPVEQDGQIIYPYTDVYLKVKASKTGVMTVNLKELGYSNSTGSVTLYDANKKRLSDYQITYNSSKTASKVYFGVNKGKTYYLRIQNCYGKQEYGYRYGVRYSITSATDRNIKTTKTAKKLSKGTTYSTLFSATNKSGSDYYKLYVSKTKTTKFTVDTTKIRSGKVYVRVYKNGKQVGATKTINPSTTKTTFTIKYGSSSGKASKGTYYIKVTKSTKGSGLYKIKYTQ